MPAPPPPTLILGLRTAHQNRIDFKSPICKPLLIEYLLYRGAHNFLVHNLRFFGSRIEMFTQPPAIDDNERLRKYYLPRERGGGLYALFISPSLTLLTTNTFNGLTNIPQ